MSMGLPPTLPYPLYLLGPTSTSQSYTDWRAEEDARERREREERRGRMWERWSYVFFYTALGLMTLGVYMEFR
jgi:hypothetical protein